MTFKKPKLQSIIWGSVIALMIAGPLFFAPKSVKADGHGIYPSDIYMTTKSDHGLLKVTKEEVKNSKKDTLNITFTLDSVADLDTKEKLTGIKFNGDANADTFYATTSHTSNGGYLDNVKAVIVHDIKDQCTYTIQWGSWDDCEFDDGTADIPKSGTEWKTGEAKTASLSVDYSSIEPIQEYADGTDDATKTFTLSIVPHFELSYNNDFSLTSHDTTSIKELQVQVMVFKDAATRDADTTQDPGQTTGNSTGTGGGGSTLADILNRILTYYILAHVRIIYWAFSNVVAPLIESLLQVHPYQDVFVEAIYLGWQLIRNLCNIFFIVILLVIGLGTLFRLESYNYKHLLVKVVIAALLVNFSLVFGQAVLGVADTVQQQFLPDSTNVIRALGSKLMVEPINKLTDSSNFSTGNATTAGASFANLTKPIFALALALGAFFTFLALAAFLVIRIVALWILLLVSPLAYVANVLPQTASYTRSWWTHFLKYAFMTPVLAFFLNLSAVFVTTMIRDQATFSQLLHTQKVSGEIAQFVYLAGSQILTILFILVGLKAASSSGTYGGQAVANFAEKGMRKPFEWYGKAAKAGGAAAADRANRYKTDKAMKLIETGEGKGGLQGGALKALGMALTPKRQYEGYKAQDTEKKEAQEKQVKGQAFDTFRKGIKVRGRTLLGGGPVSDEYFSTLDHEAAHHADHMKDKDEEYQVQELLHGMHQGSGNTRMTQQAGSLLALAQANGLNTAMDRYSEDPNNHFEKTGELSKDILNFMKDQVKHGIFSEDYAARVLESINGVGFSKRNQALMGLTYRDKNGNLKIRDTESAKDMKDMYEYQTAQRRKWEPQDIARNGHHSSIAEKDSQNRYILSGGAAHFIVDADETNFKNATRVNKAQKIKYEGALSEDPEALKKVAKAFREQNPNMTEADSLTRAADKIALFKKNYLQGQAAPSTPAPAGQTFTPNANPNPAAVNDEGPKIIPGSDFERKEPKFRKTF